MSNPFVWFHNSNQQSTNSRAFYEQLLDWKPVEGPGGMSMFAGDNGPFAAVADEEDEVVGWIPYVQVEDVDASTKAATGLGGTVIKSKTRGPAGEYSVVRDPGGAAFALWQKA